MGTASKEARLRALARAAYVQAQAVVHHNAQLGELVDEMADLLKEFPNPDPVINIFDLELNRLEIGTERSVKLREAAKGVRNFGVPNPMSRLRAKPCLL